MTVFGKILRKLRIDREELLSDMAQKLGVSPAFLSSVETGRKSVPNGWVAKLVDLYFLTEEDASELQIAADATVRQIRIDITKADGAQRNFAVAFARHFSEISEETFEKLAETLNYACV